MMPLQESNPPIMFLHVGFIIAYQEQKIRSLTQQVMAMHLWIKV